MAGGVVRAVPLAAARLALRSGAPGGRVRPAHAGPDPEHAPQPDRQGVPPRRARDDRRALRPPRRRWSSPTRSTPRSCSTRAPRPDRDAARNVRPDDHDRQHGQDVQRDRLEGRLGDRARAAVAPRCAPSTSSSPSPTRRRSRRRWPTCCRSRRATATTTASAPTTAAAAICSRGVLRGAGLEPLPIDGAYFLLTDVGARGFAERRRLLPPPRDRDRRRRHPDLRLLRRPGERRPSSPASASRSGTRRSSPRRIASAAPAAQLPQVATWSGSSLTSAGSGGKCWASRSPIAGDRALEPARQVAGPEGLREIVGDVVPERGGDVPVDADVAHHARTGAGAAPRTAARRCGAGCDPCAGARKARSAARRTSPQK